MPEREPALDPFLQAVHRQLRECAQLSAPPSVGDLRLALDEAAAGRPSPLLREPAVLSSFFANLDLLPAVDSARTRIVVDLVRRANAG